MTRQKPSKMTYSAQIVMAVQQTSLLAKPTRQKVKRRELGTLVVVHQSIEFFQKIVMASAISTKGNLLNQTKQKSY